jgi:hypothetical protein
VGNVSSAGDVSYGNVDVPKVTDKAVKLVVGNGERMGRTHTTTILGCLRSELAKFLLKVFWDAGRLWGLALVPTLGGAEAREVNRDVDDVRRN